MEGFKIDGYTLCISDGGSCINFDIDEQSGLVEVSVSDNDGHANTMYIKRDIATTLALWLKSRLSN